MEHIDDATRFMFGLEDEPVKQEEVVVEEVVEEETSEPEVELEEEIAIELQPEVKVEVEKPPETIELVYEKLKEINPDITREAIKDNFGVFLDMIKEQQEETYRLKTELAKLEAEPQVKTAKISRQVTDTFIQHQEEWKADFAEAIAEVAKDIQKLGKTKTKELEEFMVKESTKILADRIKNGKPIVNPLLLLAPKVINKIKENTQAKTEVKPQPKKPNPANLLSLNSSTVDTNTPKRLPQFRSQIVEQGNDTIKFSLGL